MFLCHDRDTGRELAVKEVQIDPSLDRTTQKVPVYATHIQQVFMLLLCTCLYERVKFICVHYYLLLGSTVLRKRNTVVEKSTT